MFDGTSLYLSAILGNLLGPSIVNCTSKEATIYIGKLISLYSPTYLTANNRVWLDKTD